MSLPNISEKNNTSHARQAIGVFGEDIACRFLEKKGYIIITRNFYVRGGEIDIIARNGHDLIVVEVKTRTSQRYGFGEEAVNGYKHKRMNKALSQYNGPFSVRYIRFDIIAVDIDRHNSTAKIRHIKNINF
ncbi:MAG: YraN family protein [bacterium]|nr:YraN family protein [bacterium]